MASTPYRDAHLVSDLELLRLVRRPRVTRTIARLLVVFFVAVAIAMSCAPWQQSSRGTGRVIAYAPLERQQSVEAPVSGRVTHWHLTEGAHVEQGESLVEIVDADPDILTRLRQERDAQNARIAAARARAAAVEARAGSLSSSRDSAMKAADGRARMARDRLVVAEKAEQAAAQALDTAKLNHDRQRALLAEGLASKRAVELADLELVRARTDLDRARAVESASRSEESALLADRMRAETDGTAAINDALATLASADADIASATAELARIEVRLARQTTQAVKAPRSGTVLRIVAKQGGEMVKEGDVLAVIVPDTKDRAVELSIDGNDVALVTPGRPVRLQFEGWPAVQFAGWPAVAVGTFGGTVAFVDAADDGRGRFRVVVVPDGKEPWPATRFLRQGSRANGWILLDRVRLGYEVWRQFNGFPPVLPTAEMYDEKPSAGSNAKEERK
jgi:adhesin transport system membrane fusion protein